MHVVATGRVTAVPQQMRMAASMRALDLIEYGVVVPDLGMR